ncbi:hypothetical protein TNCV_3472381 [Trichonephila clavipes]|nr:hypothetical protein TNCV_3472381 [Trichonephila clavipes]
MKPVRLFRMGNTITFLNDRQYYSESIITALARCVDHGTTCGCPMDVTALAAPSLVKLSSVLTITRYPDLTISSLPAMRFGNIFDLRSELLQKIRPVRRSICMAVPTANHETQDRSSIVMLLFIEIMERDRSTTGNVIKIWIGYKCQHIKESNCGWTRAGNTAADETTASSCDNAHKSAKLILRSVSRTTEADVTMISFLSAVWVGKQEDRRYEYRWFMSMAKSPG